MSGLIPGLGTCNVWELNSLKKRVDPIVHGTGRRLLEARGCNQWDDPVTYSASYAQKLDCSAITRKAAAVLAASPHRNTRFRDDILVSEGSQYFDVGVWRIHMECDRADLYFVMEWR
jgi:hypothetical protein